MTARLPTRPTVTLSQPTPLRERSSQSPWVRVNVCWQIQSHNVSNLITHRRKYSIKTWYYSSQEQDHRDLKTGPKTDRHGQLKTAIKAKCKTTRYQYLSQGLSASDCKASHPSYGWLVWMVGDSSSFVNVVCSFLVLESATVDGFRICVCLFCLWEAGSSLILLIYEAFKKQKKPDFYFIRNS